VKKSLRGAKNFVKNSYIRFRGLSMDDNNNLFGQDMPDDAASHQSSDENQSKTVKFKSIIRDQMVFNSFNVDNLIDEDHEARAILEFVDMLDLSPYVNTYKTYEGASGRKAVHPKILLSLWLYALSKGVNSAREISRLLEYNPAYQWIAGMELINYHSIASFRSDNKEALDNLFINILSILTKDGLIELERVMHDGTKIKAYASGDRFRRKDTLEQHIKMTEEHLKLLDEENDDDNLRRKAAKEKVLKERKKKLDLAKKELRKIEKKKKSKEEKENARVCLSDPESRIMKQSNGGYGPSYNAQISADSKNGIIVGAGITQEASDHNQLSESVNRIEKNTEKKPDKLIADGGFTNRENILDMSDKEIDFIGSFKDDSKQSVMQLKKRGISEAFYSCNFEYDKEKNCCTCPAGKILKYESREKRPGITSKKYRANKKDCDNCEHKTECCPNTIKGRSILKSEEHTEIRDFKKKMATEEYKSIYKTRSQVIEFVNAWIKEKINLKQFRLQGSIKVNMELTWACITYNIQQWIRLIWREKLALNAE
jgi:transposase